jgi:hypothetical protein
MKSVSYLLVVQVVVTLKVDVQQMMKDWSVTVVVVVT